MVNLGWEYAILLPEEDYVNVLQKIFEALKEIQPATKIVLGKNGLTVFGDNEKWPELLELKIDTAHNIEYVIPNGKEYLYCVFHIGGSIAKSYVDCIRLCMQVNGYQYTLEEI